MRFGINTFLFTSPFTNESTKLFPQFKKWGFDTIEIPIEDPSHIDPAHVKRELDKHGLVCGSVCACMGPDRDLRGTPKQQKTAHGLHDKAASTRWSSSTAPRSIGPVYSSVGRADAVPPTEYKTAMENGGEASQDSSANTLPSKGARFASNRSTVSKPTSSTPATRV